MELVELSIEAIETVNSSLNAVIYKMYDQAQRQVEAQPLTGPFAGVPMLLKDMNQEIRDEPMTNGSKAYRAYKASEDAHYVTRLKNAGVVFLGYTNAPEFALMAVTEPKYYGPTRNPWNLKLTPGGSSGGSAAAVATGMVPLAGASDGGGSIRIPASYCGLFGLKPSRGRTPVGPRSGRHWQGASVNHVLTRTVRDSAAMLDSLTMTERAGAFQAPVFSGSFLDELGRPFEKPLKIAFSVTSPLGTEVHPECRQAVLEAARLLENMGHHVIEKNAPVNGKSVAKSYITMYFGEVAAELSTLETVLGRKTNRRDVEPATWLLGSLGNAVSAAEFVLSLREWDDAAMQMETFHDTYDFYMTPTTALLPAKIGELELTSVEKLLAAVSDKLGIAKLLKKFGLVDTLVETSLKRTPFTQLANLTGQPAMSVPVYQTSEGLPLGVQVFARRGREDLLFRLAAELEQTSNWIDVRHNPLFLGGHAKLKP